jgi:endonuclease YncB( thermonuclease family)
MPKDLPAPGVIPVPGSTPVPESGDRPGFGGSHRGTTAAERPSPGDRPCRSWISALALASHLIASLWAAGTLGPGVLAAGWLARPPTRTCRADWVFDGDSLRLICAGEVKEVRLHCIDAPERDQVPWAKQSRRHLREIAIGNLELVERDRDRFGRVVGDVYTLGPKRRLLNLEQVEAGQAAVYERYCTDGRFERAERKAREARIGIWSSPGAQQTPWTFRHNHPR